MILVLKEYLSLLKESRELDALLPDLLLSMGFSILSRPQIGVKQFGVDLAAVGKAENGEKKLFLFVVKQGDIDRNTWDNGSNAVMQTFMQVLNVYIPKHIPEECANLKINIILCTGGDLLQVIIDDWTGFKKQNKTNNIDFQFWGGDQLSKYIEQYMLNEHIISNEYRSLLRKTLSLLPEPSYEMADYYKILQLLFFKNKTKKVLQKEIEKRLRTANLMLDIVLAWARDADNLRPAVLAAERTVLNAWNYIADLNSKRSKKVTDSFINIYMSLTSIYSEYINKFISYYGYKNGLNGFSCSGDSDVETIVLFEHQGILATCGCLNLLIGSRNKDPGRIKNAMAVCENLKQLIPNHPCLYNPLYDSHSIEISLTIFLLLGFHEIEFLSNYIYQLINHIAFAYNVMGKHFPADMDKFEDVIIESKENKNDFMQLSTLFMQLAAWIACIGDEQLYVCFLKIVKYIFPKTYTQYWYPDKKAEDVIYTENAGFHTGYTAVIHPLPDKIEDMQKILEEKPPEQLNLSDFSCFQSGLPELL
ncbi:MAG: hypothetical protein M0P01_13915, partial [Treponema sp.]|nr:hypothetical protein [Treponema sp.]